jgi:hypothetical protein
MNALERRLLRLEESASSAPSLSAIDYIELVAVRPVPGRFGGEVAGVVRLWPIESERGTGP